MKVQISDLSLFNYLMMNTLKFQWFKWLKVYDHDVYEAIPWIASGKKGLRYVELVSKELNHLVAILHVYAGGMIFMK